MKTKNVLIIGGVAVLGYYLWRMWYKKPLTTSDLTNKAPLGGGAKVIPAKDVLVDAPLTVADLSSPEAADRRNKMLARVQNPRIVQPVERAMPKEPIFVQRDNLVPNAYADNIGMPVERSAIVHTRSDYQNFVGNTATIQDVCKCSKNQPKYKSNLPQLP